MASRTKKSHPRETDPKISFTTTEQVYKDYQLWASVAHPGLTPGQATREVVLEKAKLGAKMRLKLDKAVA